MEGPEVKKGFEEAYDEHSDSVFRRCLFKVSDREVAKDITQETFVRLWDYFSSGEDIKNPKALAFRIANNLIIDHYRKKSSDSLDIMQEAGFDPSGDEDEQIVFSADKDFAIKIISSLPDMYREVIMLRFVDEMTPQEIAEIVGESENVVSVRIHRGLKKIQVILKEKDE
jgi:RNA polymerase sigma-70 factor (ECF subfamily)